MQIVNILTVDGVAIESQRIKHLSLYCLSNIVTYKEIFKKNLAFSLKPGLNLLLMADIGQVCRHSVFQDLDITLSK